MTHCKNCNSALRPNENFCHNCGQPIHLKRIDKHYVYHEVFHLLHFEKGFFYNVRELMIRPGHSIREFITENRTKHMKPIAFLILTSLLFTLISHLFHADEIYNGKEQLMFGKSSIAAIQNWVETHYGYANIIMGGFIALWVKLLFRKYQYNFFEISVLLCFVMGQGMLLLTLETFFVNVLNEQLYKILLSIISLAYPTWAMGQFFDGNKVLNYVKAFLAYFLGYLLFYAGVIFLGLLIDLILASKS
ncbi:DUF3667 domain-containing protein [Flavobacterium wongokense]|uniref:DUF3667 domain-containing protein n=1 Tax=Flavobacterium wongokense TaxID=2910674 RepID=UPI001F30A1DD|nr:DUF3667 domain-containing protein [Flavobacterium sp. WG47]MCF6131937.1 DUF3667 domain-containing protein [Flavobacterium sp. WG47]